MNDSASYVIFSVKGANNSQVFGRLDFLYHTPSGEQQRYSSDGGRLFISSSPTPNKSLAEQYETAKACLEDVFNLPVEISKDY